MALWLVAVCGDRRASMKLSWFQMCPSPFPALHMFLLKDLVLLEPNSKLSATYENGKKRPSHASYLTRSRRNSLFCLCLIPKLSKSMAQPDCCCRLKQAEKNGIVASGCVWRPPSLHEIILCPYDVRLPLFSSHVSFERSGSTWTKFQTQCNLWKRKKAPVSCKLSDASRINNLFCLCLIPKLSKSMAQPDCCCRLKQAEINGIVASGCVWWPPSLHEIILIPYDVHLLFLLFTCFVWKIWFYLNQFPNSVQPMKTEKNTRLHTSYLPHRE